MLNYAETSFTDIQIYFLYFKYKNVTECAELMSIS